MVFIETHRIEGYQYEIIIWNWIKIKDKKCMKFGSYCGHVPFELSWTHKAEVPHKHKDTNPPRWILKRQALFNNLLRLRVISGSAIISSVPTKEKFFKNIIKIIGSWNYKLNLRFFSRYGTTRPIHVFFLQKSY